MSDNIPFEIQEEIVKRVPVKSLIQFRSVSKTWNSLIDDANFIKHYSSRIPHLLVSYKNDDFEGNYVLILDDNNFPQQKVSLPVPQLLKRSNTIGSSHGLVCLYGDFQKVHTGRLFGTGSAVIWNPSIRKSVAVSVPNVAYDRVYRSVLGFGVCPETVDPKIVKITCVTTAIDMTSPSYIPRQVEVFTLSTGAWRSPYSSKLPRTSLRFFWEHVLVDGCIYWLANYEIAIDDDISIYPRLIVSFDLTSEEFTEVNLPHSLAHSHAFDLSLSKLRDSLVVIEDDFEVNKRVSRVWVMEDGVPTSFTKLFTINFHASGLSGFYVMEFRKTGEPIIKIVPNRREHAGSVAVYEPYSKSINNVGVNGRHTSFFVCSFMETLLLL